MSRIFQNINHGSRKKINYCLGLVFLSLFTLLSFNVLAEKNSALLKQTNLGELTNKTSEKLWLVVLKDPRSPRSKSWRGNQGYQVAGNYNNQTLQRLGKQVSQQHSLELIEQWPIKSIDVHCLVVKLKSDEALTIKNLQADPKVEWVQPLNEFEGLNSNESIVDAKKERLEINSEPADLGDPYYQLQASFKQLKLSRLPPYLNGEGVKIAIIDSGIQVNHTDFESADIQYENFVIDSNNMNSTNKDWDNNKQPAENHGTGIAGVIMAQPNNGKGVVGIAPAATLYGLRGCWQLATGKTVCDSLSLAKSLDRATELSPDILNLSLTGPADRLLDKIVEKIVAKGTLVVVALDHLRSADQRFPTDSNGIIFVSDVLKEDINSKTGTDHSSQKLPYIIVPGSEIITAQPTNTYAFMSGSSLSAAQLSGLMALLKQHAPEVPLQNIATITRSELYDRQSFDLCRLPNSINSKTLCSIH